METSSNTNDKIRIEQHLMLRESLGLQATCARRRHRQTRLGALFCSVSSLWTTHEERRAFLPARTARTERPAGTPKFCMLVSPACLRWTEVFGHSFCNVVVQGILEHLCDLFHRVEWTAVRRGCSKGVCLPRRDAGCDGDHRRRHCLEGRASPTRKGRGSPQVQRAQVVSGTS